MIGVDEYKRITGGSVELDLITPENLVPNDVTNTSWQRLHPGHWGFTLVRWEEMEPSITSTVFDQVHRCPRDTSSLPSRTEELLLSECLSGQELMWRCESHRDSWTGVKLRSALTGSFTRSDCVLQNFFFSFQGRNTEEKRDRSQQNSECVF